ncbi:MAG: hypothetical protein AB7U75_14190 [Hyphomicrobiaceae bacterium]
MTIHAVANEHDSYQECPYPLFSTNAVGANVDRGVLVRFGGNARVYMGSRSECWVHARVYRSSAGVGSTSFPFLTLYNSATGKDALRVYQLPTSGYWDFKYNNTGTTYTTIAVASSRYSTLNSGVVTLDFYFKRGASGVLRMFINGEKLIHETGTFNTVDTTWDYLTLTGLSTNTAFEYSDVIIGDTPTFDYKTQTLKPSANGAVSGWTGDYTDLLDSAGAIDDTTAVFTDSTSDSFTMAYENMVTPDAYDEVKAVALAASGSIDSAASISDIALYARLSATNYTLNSIGAVLGDGPVRYSQVMELNPASVAWSESDVNAVEFGGITS